MGTKSKDAEQTDAGSTGTIKVAHAALVAHLDALWTRAKLERGPRESKWQENLLVAEGEVYSAGAAGKAETAGSFRAGDEPQQTERLRVARQKVVAAKVAIGDALYKNNRMPFLLDWSAGVQGDAELLERIRKRVDEVAYTSNTPDRMRTEIEDTASFGEGWVHGTVAVDGQGRPVGGVECKCPWNMYFDASGEDDLEAAEYVICQDMMSPFEVMRMVNGARRIYDLDLVKKAVSTASRTKANANQKPGSETDRQGATLIPVRDFWCWVPTRVIGSQDVNPGDGSTDESSLDWERIRAVKIGEELVSLTVRPGPLPYYRVVWDVDRMRTLPQGVYDIMGPTQEVMTGTVRAWLNNLRRSSEVILAGRRDLIRQDVERIGDGLRFIDLDPDARDVRQAVQQFTIDGQTGDLVQAIEMLMEFADLESHIPRLQSGQQPLADSTAFEIRSRLAASGKYLNEIVRRHDACIRWVVGWHLYLMALSGEIESEAHLAVVPKGFAAFEDMVARLDGLLRLLSLGAQSPRIDARLNHTNIIRKVAQADNLDSGEVLLSDEEFAAQAQAEAESEERKLALATAQADLASKEAKADRDRAEAEARRAQPQLDRARFIRDVENDANGRKANKPKKEQP
jgi:hypothetical protein